MLGFAGGYAWFYARMLRSSVQGVKHIMKIILHYDYT